MGTSKPTLVRPANTTRKRINELFPATKGRLDSVAITSPEDWVYNCVAWALEKQDEWLEPSPAGVWPIKPNGFSVDAYADLFRHFGYTDCADGSFERGYLKVVIFADDTGKFRHVARQLPTGKWTSKLGELSDVTHTSPEILASDGYGKPAKFLRRAAAKAA